MNRAYFHANAHPNLPPLVRVNRARHLRNLTTAAAPGSEDPHWVGQDPVIPHGADPWEIDDPPDGPSAAWEDWAPADPAPTVPWEVIAGDEADDPVGLPWETTDPPPSTRGASIDPWVEDMSPSSTTPASSVTSAYHPTPTFRSVPGLLLKRLPPRNQGLPTPNSPTYVDRDTPLTTPVAQEDDRPVPRAAFDRDESLPAGKFGDAATLNRDESPLAAASARYRKKAEQLHRDQNAQPDTRTDADAVPVWSQSRDAPPLLRRAPTSDDVSRNASPSGNRHPAARSRDVPPGVSHARSTVIGGAGSTRGAGGGWARAAPSINPPSIYLDHECEPDGIHQDDDDDDTGDANETSSLTEEAAARLAVAQAILAGVGGNASTRTNKTIPSLDPSIPGSSSGIPDPSLAPGPSPPSSAEERLAQARAILAGVGSGSTGGPNRPRTPPTQTSTTQKDDSSLSLPLLLPWKENEREERAASTTSTSQSSGEGDLKDLSKCRGSALWHLGRGLVSRPQLVERLLRKGYPTATIDVTLAALEAEGSWSPGAYALAYTRDKWLQGWAPSRVAYTLTRQHAIDAEDVELAIGEVFGVSMTPERFGPAVVDALTYLAEEMGGEDDPLPSPRAALGEEGEEGERGEREEEARDARRVALALIKLGEAQVRGYGNITREAKIRRIEGWLIRRGYPFNVVAALRRRLVP